MNLKSRVWLVLFMSTLLSTGMSSAQQYRTSDDYIEGVIVYEHCDFKGKSRVLRPGNYPSIRDIGFGNDSMSSIRVARGGEAVIFEHDDFRGDYARIDRDIRCFDRRWDDQVSSIKVSEPEYRGRDRYDDQAYERPNYNTRDRGRDRARRESPNHTQVTARNVSLVVFDGLSLQQISASEWTLDSRRGASKRYQETRREGDIVYLENKYTAEQVRIDLFDNDVTFVDRDGRRQRYNIDRKHAALNTSPEPKPNHTVKPSPIPNTRIPSNCFNYKAYTKGGTGGIRFYGKDGFHRFNSKASKTGRICHNGALTMEINKTDPATDVIIEIGDKRFRFASHEKEDVLLNTWYRKKVVLQVGK